MGATFTRDQLEAKTSKELKAMCVNELNLPGLTKKPKDDVIRAIMATYGVAGGTIGKATAAGPKTLQGIAFAGQSTITKPGGAFGQKTTTTIQVSCGASSGSFPVAGRSVKEVGDFLREVLNVDRLSTGLVNGKEVDGDSILKPGDTLEFLKPAGKKG